jgi:hypothetical protein
MDVQVADVLPEGWRLWRDWQKEIAPDNLVEIEALEADHGQTIGYVRLVGRRREGVNLEEPIASVPAQYVKCPLLRGPD